MHAEPDPAAADSLRPYRARQHPHSQYLDIRGLKYHVLRWGDDAPATGARPPLVLLHGWMDVAASFQFVVDALAESGGGPRRVLAPDWRGFGRSAAPGTDTYWFPDYLADLDLLLDRLLPDTAVDLLGHSMGGNVAMIYAGLRPQRVRRLVNLEGFGMPETQPDAAPQRWVEWLDGLKKPAQMRAYDDLAAVARRLRQNNPLLGADKAAWLAPHWTERREDGRFHVLGDPAHKRVNPVLYRKDEVLAAWKRIEAPLLWVEGDQTDVSKWWGSRYTRSDFESRLSHVRQVQRERLSPCGHMLHHDQPQALATHLRGFLGT